MLDAAYAWASRKGSADQEWVTSTALEFAARPVALARILQVSPDVAAAWVLAARDGAVDAAYWAEFSPYGRGPGFELVNEAARQLLRHDRPRAALALMNLYGPSGGVEPRLVVEGLEALIRQPEEHSDKFHIDGHDIERLLEIAREADVSRSRLAQLEWGFRPALGYGTHSPILERQLAEDPAFFTQVLSMVFRARHEETHREVPEHLARNAYQLLDDWSVVPGTDEAGAIDARALDDWVDEALRLTDEADRFEIGLDQIGKVLAKAPGDPDGSWLLTLAGAPQGCSLKFPTWAGLDSRGLFLSG